MTQLQLNVPQGERTTATRSSAQSASRRPAVGGVSPTEIPRWKRAFDISGSVIALTLLAPLMTVIAVVMKLTSPGPILFRQERVGHKGKRFMCFKFRTMKVGASTANHEAHCRDLINSNRPMVKLDRQGDPRLIPLGWILRASGLDELPQIINVLRGEMSLVGPRPCLPFEYAEYQAWQCERFNTLPGLTGLWQVSGKNRTTFEEMIRLDIQYTRSKTPALDLRIMARTIPALLTQIHDTRKARQAASRQDLTQPLRTEPLPVNSERPLTP